MDGYTCYRFIFSTNGIKIFNDVGNLNLFYGATFADVRKSRKRWNICL